MNSTELLTSVIGITAATLLLIAVIIIVLLSARRQAMLRRLEESEYHSKLNTISFSALRAQMNPHFIFNCLNSIRLFVEQQNSDAASEYLTSFSRFIRHMLDSARSESIPLSTDLEMLRLYISLEGMRFKNRLSVTWNIASSLDIDYIEVPPMLIQPYVENAIWHGLMHRNEGSMLTINILQPLSSQLRIEVIDNGIGRARASLLKQANGHRSYGTQVTAERIALLNEKYEGKASITIHDLAGDLGQASGTQVIILLPVNP